MNIKFVELSTLQTTILLRTVWNKEKSCYAKWCPDWPHTGIILALSFFLSFSLYRLIYFSYFRPLFSSPLHPLPYLSLFCLIFCFCPSILWSFTYFYSLYSSSSFFFFFSISSPSHPTSTAPHPTPSVFFFFPPRLYFLFLASNNFSPSHPPLFHYSPLILSATIPVLHICCSTYLNHIFILQSLFSFHNLISLFFILIFHPFSSPLILTLFFFFASKSYFWFGCLALLVMLTWLEKTAELFGRWILFGSVLYSQSVAGSWLGLFLTFYWKYANEKSEKETWMIIQTNYKHILSYGSEL